MSGKLKPRAGHCYSHNAQETYAWSTHIIDGVSYFDGWSSIWVCNRAQPADQTSTSTIRPRWSVPRTRSIDVAIG